MISLLSSAEESIKAFLVDLTSALGFWGVLGIVAGVELLFIAFFAIKSAFSYEARLRRCLDKLNTWLFRVRTINEGNIKRFNALVKTGPKRLVYYWQQFILYRDGGPKEYLTEENLIKKPLQTSSWANNVKNLSILTYVWAFFGAVVGFAVQAATSTLTVQTVAFSLLFPALVLLLGVTAVLVIRGTRAANLDEIYHLHHLFVRFIQNACAELPPYIDFNLLFTPKEIEKGNAHLREYYEERARQAKKEFDEARANDVKYVEYNFEDVGVDGTLLLNRAMRESEKFINKKTKILSQIAQVETQKDTLRRNYENIQIDLQRKIQVSKENIKSLIEKQAATTSRIEAQLLKQQQDKEIAKQADFQKDYDQEESRYNDSREELDKEVERLNAELAKSMEDATTGMSSEYQTFFEKVMQNAYVFADKKVADEKQALVSEKDKCEDELVAVQTQIKHLLDENGILRSRLASYDPKFKQRIKSKDGKYIDGVFVDKDGGYHDENGFFHDKNGQVYNSLGELVSHDESPEEAEARRQKELEEQQVEQFGMFVEENPEEIKNENGQAPQTVQTPEETISEALAGNEEPQEKPQSPVESEVDEEQIPENATVESMDFDELFGPTTQSTTQSEPQTSQENENVVEPATAQEEAKEEVKAPEVPEEKTEESAEPSARETVEEKPQENNIFGFDDLFAEQEAQEESAEEGANEETVIPEEKKEEEKPQSEEPVSAPAKKRGRPRKEVKEEPVLQEKKKRGRPRKEEKPAMVAPAKKRGRPRKTDAEKTAEAEKENKGAKKATKKASPSKKKAVKTGDKKKPRRKSIVKVAKTDAVAPIVKRGRPRKNDATAKEIDSLARINQLIHEEEAKLKNMKLIISGQLDEAIEKATLTKIEEERADILRQVEDLQAQAINAQHEGKVEEFSSINSQIEALINRLAELNKR